MRELVFALIFEMLGAEIVDGYIMAGNRRHDRIYRDNLFLEGGCTSSPWRTSRA